MINLLTPGVVQREYFSIGFAQINGGTPYTLPISAGAYARGAVYMPLFMTCYNGTDNFVDQVAFADIGSGTVLTESNDIANGFLITIPQTLKPLASYPLNSSGVSITWTPSGGLTSGNFSGYMFYTLMPLHLIL